MRFVLTGGPGIGKTTTLEILAKRGYAIMPEIARAVIAREQQKEQGILPWTDLYEFNRMITLEQLAKEATFDGQHVFFDRGMIDNFAYCRIAGIAPPPELDALRHRQQYDHIFILDRLPHYATDNERKEDEEYAKRLHAEIENVYHELGYPMTFVPVLPPEERADYIERWI
jgi:predicted ATPase